MHISFLTPEYPHSKVNRAAGIGTSIKNLALAMREKNTRVTVFVYSQDKDDFFLDGDINVYKIKKKEYPFFGWYFYRKYLNKRIDKIITKDKISLIEVPDWTGISAFMKFSCPSVIKIHGSDTYFCHLENRNQKKKNFFFESKAIRSADYVVAVSDFSANISAKLFGLKKKIKVLPNGVDINQFKPSNLIEVHQNELLYFGSVIRKKGILELAHIFNLLAKMNKDVTLRIIGKDVVDVVKDKSTIELFFNHLSDDLRDRVIYTENVPYSQIKDEIKKASIVVLPSFAEAFPMTWLESMSLEKAIVASDIGWAKEIVDHGKNGFLENPINHQQFANYILKLLKDQKLIDAIGKEARKTIKEKFSKEKISTLHLDYYSKILSDEL